MKIRTSELIAIAAIIAITLVASIPSQAQITINLPKIPKIFREKPKAKPEPSPTSSPKAETTSVTRDTSEAYISDPNRVVKEEPRAVVKEEPRAVVNECESDSITRYHLSEIRKLIKEAEDYVSGPKASFVRILNDGKNEYLEAALLQGERDTFIKNQGANGTKCLLPALKELAAIARKKLPLFTGPVGYTNGTPAEKRHLINAVPSMTRAKVLAVGMLQPNWVIAKDRYNFPTARYKHGMIIAKYPGHEFCWLFYINLVQDYAGGGTYGASYGNYIGSVFSGCPAGK